LFLHNFYLIRTRGESEYRIILISIGKKLTPKTNTNMVSKKVLGYFDNSLYKNIVNDSNVKKNMMKAKKGFLSFESLMHLKPV